MKHDKPSQNRMKRDRDHVSNLGKVRREQQEQLQDWERKMEEWKDRVDALDQQKTTQIQQVMHTVGTIIR